MDDFSDVELEVIVSALWHVKHEANRQIDETKVLRASGWAWRATKMTIPHIASAIEKLEAEQAYRADLAKTKAEEEADGNA